jgi:3-deoxy-D-manno-octulosonic-acid transferase
MARNPFDKRTRNRMLGGLAGRYIRLVERSSRLAPGSDAPSAVLAPHHPAIIAFWHGQFMLIAPLSPPGIEVSSMVARHGDAELIGAAIETFGMSLVRGGGAAGRRKDRGGTRAFLEAVRLLGNGTSIAMTADVPPGPARRAGIGIIKLAQKSGRPIIPVAVASSRFITLDTWSRMTVNLPASRLGLAAGPPLLVPPRADAAALEEARQHLEEALDAATRRAYHLAGADPLRATPPTALTWSDPAAPASTALKIYGGATRLLAPVLPLVLSWRERKGKEDPARRGERLGHAAMPRPSGRLVWLHAASVGETNAVLPLIEGLRRQLPGCHFLLTTGTVTSAVLAARRLAPGDIHQYVALDQPAAINRFLDHWRPDVAALTESEIWPNTILAAHARGVPLVLVNARMSDRSYRRWRRYKRTARALFGRFRLILAQNERLTRRFRELGARAVEATGNLKVDAPPLPVDTTALAAVAAEIAGRPVLLAASTHPGEERIVLEALGALSADPDLEDLLLVVVPRHPERGGDVAAEAAGLGLTTARRSAGEAIMARTKVYIADTLGELGLFYSLADAAYIGGSLVPHGGQNPLEAIRLGAAVLSGPHVENFADVYEELRRRGGVRIVEDRDALAAAARELIIDQDIRQALTLKARSAMSEMTGALDRTVDALAALIPPPPETDTARRAGAPATRSRKLSRAS